MLSEYLLVNILIIILVAYWGVLIGSSLLNLLVGYVTQGEHETPTLMDFLDDLFNEDGGFILFCSIICTLLYTILTFFVQELCQNGYGGVIWHILQVMLILYGVLRLAKWVYAINTKLNNHIKNKEAH